jgi:hypothetical protein
MEKPVFLISFERPKNKDISIIHSLKMNLNEYFSSIGGLLSMWFGISFYNSMTFVFRKLTQSSRKFITRIRRQSLSIMKVIKFLRLNSIILFLIFVVDLIAMLLQIIDCLRIYLKYDTIIRFEVSHKVYNSGIELKFSPFIENPDKLMEIFPKFRAKFKKLDRKMGSEMKPYKMITISMKYLEKLVSSARFEGLYEILNAKNFIISCQLSIGDQSLDCSNTSNGFLLTRSHKNYLTFSLFPKNKSQNYFETSPKREFHKILIILKNLDGVYLNLGNEISYQTVRNPKTNIGFSSYSVKKLLNSMHKRKNGSGCHEILKNILSKSCPTDCYLFLTNRTFGYFPYPRNEIHLEFEYHIHNIGHKFCENSINFTERMSAFLVYKCLLDICSPNCENIYFKTKFNTISGKLNQTVLELYPIESKHFEYIIYL